MSQTHMAIAIPFDSKNQQGILRNSDYWMLQKFQLRIRKPNQVACSCIHPDNREVLRGRDPYSTFLQGNLKILLDWKLPLIRGLYQPIRWANHAWNKILTCTYSRFGTRICTIRTFFVGRIIQRMGTFPTSWIHIWKLFLDYLMCDPYTYQHSQHIDSMVHVARCLFRKQYNIDRDRVCFHQHLFPNIDLSIKIMKPISFNFVTVHRRAWIKSERKPIMMALSSKLRQKNQKASELKARIGQISNSILSSRWI